MDFHTAIERACKHAHENSDEQARSGEYGGTYLKHVATAEFYRLAANEGVDLSDHSPGSIAVAILRGVSAVQEAEA